jgi:hypothetical protein
VPLFRYCALDSWNIHGYWSGGNFLNSWVFHISASSFWYDVAHSTTSLRALTGRSPSTQVFRC